MMIKIHTKGASITASTIHHMAAVRLSAIRLSFRRRKAQAPTQNPNRASRDRVWIRVLQNQSDSVQPGPGSPGAPV